MTPPPWSTGSPSAVRGPTGRQPADEQRGEERRAGADAAAAVVELGLDDGEIAELGILAGQGRHAGAAVILPQLLRREDQGPLPDVTDRADPRLLLDRDALP